MNYSIRAGVLLYWIIFSLAPTLGRSKVQISFRFLVEVNRLLSKYIANSLHSQEVSMNVRTALPSPCTASFQALSVNALRWRIRDERPGDASKTFSDHVTRDSSALHNNEAKGLGNEQLTSAYLDLQYFHRRSSKFPAEHLSLLLASLLSLTLRFQPRSRPFVWLLALTWISKNTDCFAV